MSHLSYPPCIISSYRFRLLSRFIRSVPQEILLLINDHLSQPTTPHLPRTLETLREEIQVRTRQDEEREGERDRLAGRVLGSFRDPMLTPENRTKADRSLGLGGDDVDGDWTEAERMLGATPGLVRNSKAFL